jgi:hypothetical protein
MFEPAPSSRYLDKFGWLLVLTYGSIAAQSLVDVQDEYSGLGQELGNLVAVLVASAMLVLAMHASGVNRRWRIGIWITILISVSAHVLAVGTQVVFDRPLGSANLATIPIGALVLSLLSFVFVIHRLLRHRRVTSSTLLGAITAYLFIPLTFYYAFLVVDGLTNAPFFGSPRPGPDFMFFSLTTVTTLGYGDLVPAIDLGELLATTEALLGQLYLVVVVALIVGLMASRWQNDRPAEADQ